MSCLNHWTMCNSAQKRLHDLGAPPWLASRSWNSSKRHCRYPTSDMYLKYPIGFYSTDTGVVHLMVPLEMSGSPKSWSRFCAGLHIVQWFKHDISTYYDIKHCVMRLIETCGMQRSRSGEGKNAMVGCSVRVPNVAIFFAKVTKGSGKRSWMTTSSGGI